MCIVCFEIRIFKNIDMFPYQYFTSLKSIERRILFENLQNRYASSDIVEVKVLSYSVSRIFTYKIKKISSVASAFERQIRIFVVFCFQT